MSHILSHILVPVDGSASSLRAVRFAAGLASATEATLILLHVHWTGPSELMGMRSKTDAEMIAVKDAVSEAAFAGVEDAVAEYGAPVVRTVVFGDPAVEVLACARRNNCELIVMGCRGLSQLEGLLLGSVSAKVVKLAHCAVTVVR